MNVLMLLKPKKDVAFIYESSTIRQGLTKMRTHGYSAIPVLDDEGRYVGSVSDSDFLWHLIDQGNASLKDQEKHYIRDIMRKDFSPAVRINVTMDELLDQAMKQNYVCVTDDRDVFIGIVTRRDIIRCFIDKIPTSSD
ncbi:MAG: CBS domain-containing protein [Clostridia bacterium]|nr:CBS domain-containing protein [Clostridia bacterium]